MSSEKSVNPCPFCGKNVTLDRMQIDIYWVRHIDKIDCGLGHHVTIYAETDEEATELWNKAKVSNGKIVFEKPD